MWRSVSQLLKYKTKHKHALHSLHLYIVSPCILCSQQKPHLFCGLPSFPVAGVHHRKWCSVSLFQGISAEEGPYTVQGPADVLLYKTFYEKRSEYQGVCSFIVWKVVVYYVGIMDSYIQEPFK